MKGVDETEEGATVEEEDVGDRWRVTAWMHERWRDQIKYSDKSNENLLSKLASFPVDLEFPRRLPKYH
jgi:hypothetical protein